MTARRRVSATISVLASGLVILAGCGSGSAAPTATATAGSSTKAPTSITVFAAASLKMAFTALGDTFAQQNPGSTVTFSFAGSSDLAAQIIAGAPADVFASADEATMGKVSDAGGAAGPATTFATNTLTIVTPPGNPRGITRFADLAGSGRNIVVCAPQVPCGAATKKLQAAAGVTLTPVSEESSVADVLNKVEAGEADAGLVYVTDAKAAGDKVAAVPFAESGSVVNKYRIATLTEAIDPELAATFAALVTGPQGQQELAAAGFGPGA